MWYATTGADSFDWASLYNTNRGAAHNLIKVFVPNSAIVGGIAGNAGANIIARRAARTMEGGFGGTWHLALAGT